MTLLRIGITGSADGRSPRFPELYAAAVNKAGGETVMLLPGSRSERGFRECAGLLIPGGGDIAPSAYGEEQRCDLQVEDPERSRFEQELLARAGMEKRPVLGICYGMQLINVVRGGTLIQDIVIERHGSLDHRTGSHEVRAETNPFFPDGPYVVNTSHHQAVGSAAGGMVPFCYSSDGIIEAMYAPDHPFLLGVQWHPERMAADDITRRIFSGFVEACRAGR